VVALLIIVPTCPLYSLRDACATASEHFVLKYPRSVLLLGAHAPLLLSILFSDILNMFFS
jgi:hypothetical protein